MAEVASIEAAPIAGASSVQTPAVDSQTAANAPVEQQGQAANYEDRTRNALRDAMLKAAQPTEEAPYEEPTAAQPAAPPEATQPAQEAAGDKPVEGEQQPVDDAEPTPEDYGPDDVKAALKRIHPDARKVLHNAFYRSEEIKKLGYKVEDLRLWHNAGLTSERMLTTLQRFPVPENEEQALIGATSWQKLHDDLRLDPRRALVNLARTEGVDPDTFKRFVTEAAAAAEFIDPQMVSRKDRERAQRWITIAKERGKKLGGDAGDNLIAAAEIFAQDMGIDGQSAEPEMPEEYRRRMSELDRREQESRQREQAAFEQHRSGFTNAVYTTVATHARSIAEKNLGDGLSPDQKSWVMQRALAGVEQKLTGNELLMKGIQRMVDNGPMDQGHHAAVSDYLSKMAERLVVTELASQLKELKKLSTQAPPVRATSPSQATVSASAKPAVPAPPRREPIAQGATPPPPPAKIEIQRGGGGDAYAAAIKRALGYGG